MYVLSESLFIVIVFQRLVEGVCVCVGRCPDKEKGNRL